MMASFCQTHLRCIGYRILRLHVCLKNETQTVVFCNPSHFTTQKNVFAQYGNQRWFSRSGHNFEKKVNVTTKTNIVKENRKNDAADYESLIDDVSRDMYGGQQMSKERRSMRSTVMKRILQMEGIEPGEKMSNNDILNSLIDDIPQKRQKAKPKDQNSDIENVRPQPVKNDMQESTTEMFSSLIDDIPQKRQKAKPKDQNSDIENVRPQPVKNDMQESTTEMIRKKIPTFTADQNGTERKPKKIPTSADDQNGTEGLRFDLENVGRLNIFSEMDKNKIRPQKELPADTNQWTAVDWFNKYESDVLQGLMLKDQVTNSYQEQIMLTKQGKMWSFPVNNEEGMEEEEKIPFYSHVFLDDKLEGWCPQSGPLRMFMNAVVLSLSMNGHISLQEKYEHIDWFRQYFEEKMSVLKKIGAVDS